MNDADYMRAAIRASVASTDRSRKVGCVIVNDLGIVAEGYNAFPVGVSDIEERHERPEKYFWTEHAERSAIYEAAKTERRSPAPRSMFLGFPAWIALGPSP